MNAEFTTDPYEVIDWAKQTQLGTVRHQLDVYEREDAVSKAVARLWRVIERGGQVNRPCVWHSVRRGALNEVKIKGRREKRILSCDNDYFEEVPSLTQSPDASLAVWSVCTFTAPLDPVASMVMLLVGAGQDFKDAERRVRGPIFSNRIETRERMKICYQLWERA